MRRFPSLVVLACALLVPTTQAFAQRQRNEPRGGMVRVAKWTLLASSAALASYALVRSRDAERAYGDLYDKCAADNSVCSLSGGRYTDPDAEALYQRAVRGDKQARVGIIGGQIALFGSAALFIVDLRHAHGPRDIPYPSKLDRGVGAGVTWHF